MSDFEFLGSNDKPALIAITSPEWAGVAHAVLSDLGFKGHTVTTPADFSTRFSQLQYQVCIIDESFGGTGPQDNVTLSQIQKMPMAQRRHCVFILLSSIFESMNSLQAFQQSVHMVVNYNDLSVLAQVVQKAVSDNTIFYQNYLEIQKRLTQGKN